MEKQISLKNQLTKKNESFFESKNEIEKVNPFQQVKLLLITLKEDGNVISFIKELEKCDKTFKDFICRNEIHTFNVKNLIDLILDSLKSAKQSTIPSLLNLIGIICYKYKNTRLIGERGGMEVIFNLMKLHFNCADTQYYICKILCRLIRDCENAPRIKEREIKMVIQLMKLHIDHTGVQEKACKILGNYEVSGPNKNWIRENRGIEMIIQAMRIYPNNMGVQKNACNALKLLAWNHDDRILIGNNRGIELIIKMIKIHANDGYLQELGMSILCRLCSIEENWKLVNKLAFDI